MQETLKAAFGELGAVVVQFILTVVIVLAAIALVYWLVRRYSGIRLGGIGRGRVPRLAVVDAMAIDSRRQLVLIRRDNVEHLILIGGPADLVVEPSIQRPRARPAQQPAQAAAAQEAARLAAQQQPVVSLVPTPPPGEPAPPPGVSEPIPFPPQRVQRAAPPSDRVTLRTLTRPAAPAEPPPPARPEPEQPVWVAPRDATAAFRPPVAETPASVEPFLPAIVEAEAAELEQPLPAPQPEVAMAEEEADETRQPALDLGEGGAPATDPAETQAAPEAETASRVSDLEREMARLLGEITAKRSN